MGSPSHLLLPRLLFRPPPPFLSLLLLNPLPASPTALPLHLSTSSPPRSSRLLSSLSSLSLRRHVVPSPCSLPSELEFDSVPGDSGDERNEEEDDEPEFESADVDGGGESEVRVSSAAAEVEAEIEKRNVPELTVKEKKELASYAHSLGDKLKSQQVGKSGVSANSVMAFNETLEANELLKIKIHRTCPGEFDDVVKELEQRTGSVAVGQIGRIVIFYRPSISKLKAVEKKKQARKIFLERKLRSSPTIQGRERGSREYDRSRRGSSSRFSTSTRSEQ